MLDAMNFWTPLVLLVAAGCTSMQSAGDGAVAQPGKEGGMTNIYSFTARDIDGKEISLSTYKGKVLLIVNVASKCGFTGQYAGLERLYRDYKGEGLVVLGFPANNFLGQEPGTDEEIQQFCSLTYDVTFPMFAKISVKGRNIHPLYGFLTSKETHPRFGGAISWNFNKFLVGRDGTVLARFGSRTKPDDGELIAALKQALAASE
jgi:glutathione peroxidase